MAFTAGALNCQSAARPDVRGKIASALGTSLSAGITTLSAVGGNTAVGLACAAFLDAWRQTSPETLRLLSANRTVAINASATSALLTVQFQIVATS